MKKVVCSLTFLLLILFACGGSAGDQKQAQESPKAPVVSTGDGSGDLPQKTVPPTDLPLDRLKMPAGFSVSLAAQHISGARSLALGDKGTLFVGSRRAGDVHALVDRNKDGYYETVHVLAQGWNMPNGVAFRDGSLYVAEINRILRFDDIEANLAAPPEPVVVFDDLPDDPHHGWKFIAFGPDGRLYVPVGAPCNICDAGDPYAAILSIKADGSDPKVFARGVRNTVGFDWHPDTKELWFTDNGRDLMGDDLPPDELNHAPRAGLHFGYPYCHGQDIRDPKFGKGKSCGDYRPAVQDLDAHVAALGMSFYTGEQFPEPYRKQIIIPEHGSWNRSKKAGYRLTLVTLEGNRAVSYVPFVTGWLGAEEDVWGRPVDTLVMPDGSLLVSDDYADAIYRISYTAPAGS